MSEKKIIEVGPGYYNFRGTFKKFLVVDMGTHMSLVRLSNGNYLVIDTIELDDEIKGKIDYLTDNGSKIEAVLGTHPFHTLAFPDFHRAYPNVPYYGTPRHIRTLTSIAWSGNLHDAKIRNKWAPEIEMRIPDGAEFVAPEPESKNHFSSCWVFHKESRTIHVDDTLIYCDNPGLLLKLFGLKDGEMFFHPAIKGPGLYPTKEAPIAFRTWVMNLIHDWDFDNVCVAHKGYKIGGAKQLLQDTLNKADALLTHLSQSNSTESVPNFTGNECG